MNRLLKTVLALAFSTGLLVGCGGSKDPWDTVYPVKGTVKFEGKPISGAQVFLLPVDSKVPASVRPSATSSADGTFEVGTHSAKDGAPAGDYKISVVWYPLVQTEGGPVRGDNKLPPKYAKPESSELTATIKPEDGGTTLAVFELKK